MTNKVLLIFFLFAISSASLSKDINTECKEFIKNSEISENNANQKEKLLFEESSLEILLVLDNPGVKTICAKGT